MTWSDFWFLCLGVLPVVSVFAFHAWNRAMARATDPVDPEVREAKAVGVGVGPGKVMVLSDTVIDFVLRTCPDRFRSICPACSCDWYWEASKTPPVCVCEEVEGPHFHLACVNSHGHGCGYAWAMRGANVKAAVPSTPYRTPGDAADAQVHPLARSTILDLDPEGLLGNEPEPAIDTSKKRA